MEKLETQLQELGEYTWKAHLLTSSQVTIYGDIFVKALRMNIGILIERAERRGWEAARNIHKGFGFPTFEEWKAQEKKA